MKQIFIVHDQQEDPLPRQRALECSGYRVRSFTSGRDALDALPIDRPDAVVMDILLEGPNGFEICRSMRALYPAEELPIILCSSIYRKRAFKQEAWDAGAQGYLLRPIDIDDLVKHLHTAWTHKAQSKTTGSV